jgi:predicted nucleotidyltransferase
VSWILDPGSSAWKLCESKQLMNAAVCFNRHKEDIKIGGGVNFAHGTVDTTVILKKEDCSWNFDELFSPIIFASVFRNDNDLFRYIMDSRYKQNEMYVSVYGSIPKALMASRSIILKESTIHDIEDGSHAYGGYSMGASYVQKFGVKRAKPLYLLHEIKDYAKAVALRDKSGNFLSSEAISNNFKKKVHDIFSDNLEFAFIFGSVAKGLATEDSDIDTFIAVKSHDSIQENKYISWLRNHTSKLGMTFDEIYPAEIVTISEMKNAWNMFVDLNSDEIIDGNSYDAFVWAEALLEEKCNYVGDTRKINSLLPIAGKSAKSMKNSIWSAFARSNHAVISGLDEHHQSVCLGEGIAQQFTLSELSSKFNLQFTSGSSMKEVEEHHLSDMEAA